MLERRHNPGREVFFRDYLHANRPVILTGLLDAWPAVGKWSPQYLKSVCGDQIVEVMSGRDADPDFERNCQQHRAKVEFGVYIDEVVAGGSGNDRYMVANNRFMDTEAGVRLRADIVCFPEYLDPGDTAGRMFFWLGPAGTVTPLHYDTTNIFLAQVVGHKRICLIPPNQTPLMYNRVGVFSDVDYEKPHLGQFPLFSLVTATVFLLNPGEVLFIPINWWHHVRGVTPSLSVSLTNFLNVVPADRANVESGVLAQA
jgi:cupin-like protein